MKVIPVESLSDLKPYLGRQGFIVKFNPPTQKTDSDSIDATMITSGVVTVAPELVYSFGDIWMFIYPENTYLDMKLFYGFAEGPLAHAVMRSAGARQVMWEVDGLEKFIKENI